MHATLSRANYYSQNKSRRRVREAIKRSQVCRLEHCRDHLLYCTTVGSKWSVNCGWYVAAGRIQSFMWLQALHSSPLSCPVLPKCAWSNWAPFSRRHGPFSAPRHLLSDFFFWFRALLIWSVQLTCAPISGVIYFAPRVRVMKHTTEQHMTSSWWWSWGWQTMWTFWDCFEAFAHKGRRFVSCLMLFGEMSLKNFNTASGNKKI